MLDYNLLVAFRAGKEEEAEDEMVKRARDAGAEIEDWNVSMAPDLYLVRVNGEARRTVQKIIRLAEHFPDVFAYTVRWTPVDEWINAEEEMIRAVVERYRQSDPQLPVTLNILHSCSDKFSGLAESLSANSSAQPPESGLLINVLGDTAAITLLSKQEELMDINQIRAKNGLPAV
ncbi:hypothetical protein [Candidatus Methanomassiliicoccus intestinalis]|uniref:hypothetical protein n=1 Tax=Candidatus Methanomassiliicoccus intestinalis TaxID=1406512 RepID=UPI0037DC45FC